MSGWREEELRRDAYLGGRVHLWQPRRGYRAGVDPVLLAAAVPARPGERVLDLGCGAGAVGLCLAARVPGLALAGLELQPGFAALARRNGAEAGCAFDVYEGDVRNPPKDLRARSFDHVMMNPPYYDRARGSTAPDAARETALGEEAPLAEWIATGARRLAPRGWLHVILKAERLADALGGLSGRLGSVAVLPLVPRAGRDAELVLIRARKEGRAALRMLSPVILHRATRHEGDHPDYSARIAAVLRDGKPLEFQSDREM